MQGNDEPQARILADALVNQIEQNSLWDEWEGVLYHRDVRSLGKQTFPDLRIISQRAHPMSDRLSAS